MCLCFAGGTVLVACFALVVQTSLRVSGAVFVCFAGSTVLVACFALVVQTSLCVSGAVLFLR